MIVAEKCHLSRRADSVIIVRVPSTGQYGSHLPDAVFTFRPGDPQYSFWLRECTRREEPAEQLAEGGTTVGSKQ